MLCIDDMQFLAELMIYNGKPLIKRGYGCTFAPQSALSSLISVKVANIRSAKFPSLITPKRASYYLFLLVSRGLIKKTLQKSIHFMRYFFIRVADLYVIAVKLSLRLQK